VDDAIQKGYGAGAAKLTTSSGSSDIYEQLQLRLRFQLNFKNSSGSDENDRLRSPGLGLVCS